MRKFILLFIGILFCVVNCNAQLTIKSTSNKQYTRVGTVRPTYSYIYTDGEIYDLIIDSSNRFDKSYIISLGDKDSAIETLNILINIGESESIVIAENNKIELSIYGKKAFGISAIFIKGKTYAGDCSLNVSELKKAIKIIQSHSKCDINKTF